MANDPLASAKAQLAVALAQLNRAVNPPPPPRGDGLRRPLNAPPAGQVATGVQPGVSNGVVVAHYVIITGTAGGVFVYNGTPGLGNPPIAWMTSGTTDPYGNPLPYDSTLGIASTATFSAGDTLITPNGIFTYSGTPSASDLVASLTGSATTDPFSTDAQAGITAYGSSGAYAQMSPESSLSGQEWPSVYLLPGGQAHINQAPVVTSYLQSAGAANEVCGILLQSGSEDNSAPNGGVAGIILYSGAANNSTTPSMELYLENTEILGLTLTEITAGAPVFATEPGAGTGTPEPWHAMAVVNGWTTPVSGNVACKYRLLASPPNTVEIIGTMGSSAATSSAFFQLPTAYKPASQQQFWCSPTQNPTVYYFGQCDTTGTLRIETPSVADTNAIGPWVFHGFISLDA